MNSQTKPLTSQKASISIEAWELICKHLDADKNPSPDREYYSLVAEQERLRNKKLLEHNLAIVGMNYASA